MSGRTIGGMARHTTSSAATAKPQARISSAVGRLQQQPHAKRRHGWSSLSWHAARNREVARTCSMNSNCPSGRRTRAISRSARSGSSGVRAPQKVPQAVSGARSLPDPGADVVLGSVGQPDVVVLQPGQELIGDRYPGSHIPAREGSAALNMFTSIEAWPGLET